MSKLDCLQVFRGLTLHVRQNLVDFEGVSCFDIAMNANICVLWIWYLIMSAEILFFQAHETFFFLFTVSLHGMQDFYFFFFKYR